MTLRKWLVGVTVTTPGITWLVRRYLSLRNELAQVPVDLRSALLPFLTSSVTARSLPAVRLIFRIAGPRGPGVEVEKHCVPGKPPVRVVVTRPSRAAGRPHPAVLHLHAGGTIMGSPQAEAPLSGQLARELDAVVISPDYRLAPENPFPAAIDDCMATLRWIFDSADELGIDRDRIAVAGASAGGGLSAAVAQRAVDEGIQLRAQALIYPMLDDRTVLQPDHGGRGRFVWTPRSNLLGWTSYLGRPPRTSDAPEYAVPARRVNLAGLPPAWIGIGELDLFYQESLDYAEALNKAGVQCEILSVAGMYHGADVLAANAPAMKDFRRSFVEHLRKYL